MSYISVAIGGFLGAVARYYLTTLPWEKAGNGFPWGTLLVNLTGCLFLGFFLAVAIKLLISHAYLVTGLSSGFTGAYTTFSTFNLDTLHLIQAGRTSMALLYVLISAGGGLLLIWAGDRAGSVVLSPGGVFPLAQEEK
ncbi:fluoride efflux transporter CrcB [Desulfotomaculum copahuensis]|uniref:Fluoride-specific ion channel FluC n=1 Tax=Desulfotomaculum copahuensis TaxID=1838280 RepID=A0A1B7LJ66_9FIRM|nr:fluoride efflux transporter CrcB [Desulfotomaculum copahuensis]OAT86512.1 hypothetical protein A6M21_03630 [Desulfotomaculum copahuensis]